MYRIAQARQLDELRGKVEREIAAIHYQESVASVAFNKAMIINRLTILGGGKLISVLSNNPKLFSNAKRIAFDSVKHTASFGTVIVAIGESGIPNDVQVIALSAQARKLQTTDHEIKMRLEKNGYVTMAESHFYNYVNTLKDRVLTGEAILPVIAARYLLKPIQA